MTTIPKDKPEIETLIDIWPSAEFHEQETFENFGITFINHPRMEKLLLPALALITAAPIVSPIFIVDIAKYPPLEVNNAVDISGSFGS